MDEHYKRLSNNRLEELKNQFSKLRWWQWIKKREIRMRMGVHENYLKGYEKEN